MIASNVERFEAVQTIKRQLGNAAVDKDEAAQLAEPVDVRQTSDACA